MSKEVLPNHCQMIMVAEREKVDRLVRRQHTRRCPSPVLPLREGTGSARTKLFLRRNNPDAVEINGLLKPTGNVGQPANGNLQYLKCQCEIG